MPKTKAPKRKAPRKAHWREQGKMSRQRARNIVEKKDKKYWEDLYKYYNAKIQDVDDYLNERTAEIESMREFDPSFADRMLRRFKLEKKEMIGYLNDERDREFEEREKEKKKIAKAMAKSIDLSTQGFYINKYGKPMSNFYVKGMETSQPYDLYKYDDNSNKGSSSSSSGGGYKKKRKIKKKKRGRKKKRK